MNDISILYEDEALLVVNKPRALLSEASDDALSLPNALAAHAAKDFPLSPVTRLDRGVSGVMVLAKTKKSAAYLSAELSNHESTEKEYRAVVAGCLTEKQGTLTDLLFKDSSKNKSFVVKRPRRGVKEASLSYSVLAECEREGKRYSLLSVRLHTGRTHQIRVQLSSRRHPLLGDGKYGGESGYPIALLAYRLTFRLPSGKRQSFSVPMPEEAPFTYFVDFMR